MYYHTIPAYRTKTLTLYLVVMALSHHIGQYTSAAQAPFTLVDFRTAGSNIITLRCRNSDDVFDSQAMYFLNGRTLDSIDGFEDTDEDSSTVVFQINRRLEGEYSCGTQLQRSQSLFFVGKGSKDSLKISAQCKTYSLSFLIKIPYNSFPLRI